VDEVGQLGETFNQMADQIEAEVEAIRQAEERYRILSESLEQTVQRRTEELQLTNKELESFAYSVSHDLRAPLRTITGFANIIIEDYQSNLEPEIQSHLQRIVKATNKMAELIDALLNFSRLGRAAINKESINLAELTQNLTSCCPSEQETRQIEWVIGELPVVEADPVLIEQVFVNLINNAVKYTRGRKPAQIEIGSYLDQQQRVFFIKDNGVGFNMQYADKLFGVFQRLHAESEFEGTGIGLATVQRIIYRHEGKIWAEAIEGEGATFYFTLG
jgi:light-regulated signal transduction histidine kinase (bacteriophytochrome)